MNVALMIISMGVLLFSSPSQADNSSSLGIDYLKAAKNPIIADIMIEIEPNLLKLFRTKIDDEKRILRGVKGVARSLGKDMISKPMYKNLYMAFHPALLRLSELSKDKYPNMNLLAQSLKLDMDYKRKYGVDYKDEFHEEAKKLKKAFDKAGF